jgi:hypothetical protein
LIPVVAVMVAVELAKAFGQSAVFGVVQAAA